MSICDECYKKSVCKLTSPNMAGCIEYLPRKAIKQYWLDKVAKIRALCYENKKMEETT